MKTSILSAGGAYLFAQLAGLAASAALAADLGPGRGGDGYGYGPPPGAYVPGGVVYDAVDARCRIIPNPQLDLVGDTARFRPTAVCLSRGLYADSLGFPQAPVLYGPLYGPPR
jgi:hypothetical protein